MVLYHFRPAQLLLIHTLLHKVTQALTDNLMQGVNHLLTKMERKAVQQVLEMSSLVLAVPNRLLRLQVQLIALALMEVVLLQLLALPLLQVKLHQALEEKVMEKVTVVAMVLILIYELAHKLEDCTFVHYSYLL